MAAGGREAPYIQRSLPRATGRVCDPSSVRRDCSVHADFFGRQQGLGMTGFRPGLSALAGVSFMLSAFQIRVKMLSNRTPPMVSMSSVVKGPSTKRTRVIFHGLGVST
jgi:hypothetical protein